ncbi:hypothetical protein [Xanthobacter aminoxidans]|uniref:Transposase n=1 Tax=Xanthobacter aminoxidans TaxID=186280 RepID=A0ABW6ZA00_9HYPH
MTEPKAWIVLVWTDLNKNGMKVLVGYAAGFSDLEDAVEAVLKHLGEPDNSNVCDPAPLRQSTIDALNIRPGEVRML